MNAATIPPGQSPALGHGGLLLRLGVFFFLEYIGLSLFSFLFVDSMPFFYASILSTFSSAVLANFFAVRIYERGRLEHVGMGWGSVSSRHLWLGAGLGAGAALAVTVVPVAAGMARWVAPPTADQAFSYTRLLGVAAGLLFGAVGEELLFRGYGFQVLLARYNPWAVVVGFSALFGWMHHWNPAATLVSDINTALWGAVLGYALLRSGALWLPIGLHFGWNLALPLAGAPLSGFPLPLGPRVIEWRVDTMWSGGAYGPEGGLLCTLVACGVGVWLWRSKLEREPGLLLDASNQNEAAVQP